ncbi:NAD(P)H-binding protein [Streptomyces lonarensis]|uniref:NAD(P)H-binding protein n=1 Tax=Streptomyces lonarensis TaxID=700599 RepID=A0A7X6CZQ5_9ACTN|nr:NAD(P)H-binding protein [Streptomyces lonarensis]NJQ05529.1 NAD(P)H-binding protein [Streptomyces lonarensis]
MIGILGASGAVGRHATAALAADGPLRLGARRTEALRNHARTDDEVRAVDATDPGSLAAFCAGCSVVLNCAGPSYALKETVALAALAAGADYVDVLGDDPVHEALTATGPVPAGRSAVLSAGTVPGLSRLAHRLLTESAAGDRTRPTRLVAHAGGLEHATGTVAADILLSLRVGGAGGEPYGHPLAAWRQGRRVPRALRIEESAEVPYFPAPVARQPLLTAEIERAARVEGLDDAEWYNVFPGSQVRALFSALPTLPADTPEQRAELIDRIVRAGATDLAGAEPYYRLVLTLSGAERWRTLVVRTDDSYRLTAAVAVQAVRALAAGGIAPGVHFAGEVLDPAPTIAALERGGAGEFLVHEGAAEPGGHGGFEDGEL